MQIKQILATLPDCERQSLMFAFHSNQPYSYKCGTDLIIGVNFENSPHITLIEQSGVWYLGRLKCQ